MVELAHGEDGVSPGQACVFYTSKRGGERLLGGGWIKSAGRSVGGRGRLPGVRATRGAGEPLAAGSR